MAHSNLPLSGVRVLDFSRVLAGPLCTMILGDLGAEVIKVESPFGDETRQWGPPYAGQPADGMSAYYLSVNRNKRSITLNLKTQEARQIARQLAAGAHVLVENLKVGGMAAFGLGYDDLRAINPALVYCSITGFGQSGPYAQRPGYDFVIQAMSGLMAITGPADGEPYKVGVAVSDVFTGLYAANAIQAALRHAERTGEGQHLDVSLLESQLAALVNVASNFLIGGAAPARYGNAHPNIVPYQAFAASDGMFVLACGNDGQFRALCSLLARADLAADPRFATNPQRVHNRDLLIPILAREFEKQPAEAWVNALLGVGIPAGAINTVPAALNDAHLMERGVIEQGELANGEIWRHLRFPVQMSATPAQTQLPPPMIGQHTDEVLRDLLGLKPEEIAQLRESGVI